MTVMLELSYINSDMLQAGDICLKYGDGSKISGAISFGQKLLQGGTDQGNISIVHAGIMLDENNIIESQGSGVTKHDMRTDNRGYDYEIYRCLLTNIAAGAAAAAEIVLDSHNAGKTANYSLGGAVKSLFGAGKPANASAVETIMTRLTNGEGRDFFCSQFVVYCFQMAAEQNGLAAQNLFDLADANYSPNKLKDSLFKSQYFFKAGMLRAGIR